MELFGGVIRAPNIATLLASHSLVPATDTPEEFEEFVRAQVEVGKILKPTEMPPP